MFCFFKKLTLIAPAFFCILLSTLLATMVEETLFKWCFQLFFHFSGLVSIHHDLLFLLVGV